MLLFKPKYGSMLHLTLFVSQPFVDYPFPVFIVILSSVELPATSYTHHRFDKLYSSQLECHCMTISFSEPTF